MPRVEPIITASTHLSYSRRAHTHFPEARTQGKLARVCSRPAWVGALLSARRRQLEALGAHAAWVLSLSPADASRGEADSLAVAAIEGQGAAQPERHPWRCKDVHFTLGLRPFTEHMPTLAQAGGWSCVCHGREACRLGLKTAWSVSWYGTVLRAITLPLMQVFTRSVPCLSPAPH